MKEISELNKSVNMGKGVKFCVDTRAIYEFLGAKQTYRKWIQQRLVDSNAIENEDYIITAEFGRNSGPGRPFKDYATTIDMAQHIAMMEKGEVGKKIRQFYVEKARELKSINAKTRAEMLLEQAQQLVDLEKQQMETIRRLQTVEAKIQTINESYYTIAGYATLINNNVTQEQARKYGHIAAKLSREKDYPIDKVYNTQYGQINAYHVDILEIIFNQKQQKALSET